MSSNKVDILTNMYVSAKYEIERELKNATTEDLKTEYQQELDEFKSLYQELFDYLHKGI